MMLRLRASLVAGGVLAGSACSGAPAAPSVTPAPPLPSAPCGAAAASRIERAAALASSGKLDEALAALEEPRPGCEETDARLAEATRAALVELDRDPKPVPQLVEEGWRAREAGRPEDAHRAFSRAIRAGVRDGTPPAALPLVSRPLRSRSEWHALQPFPGQTLVGGALAGGHVGAVVLRFQRTGQGVAVHPIRVVALEGESLPAAFGPGERFALVSPMRTLLFSSPTAPARELPGGDSAFFTQGGASLVIDRDEGLQAFDTSTGAARAPIQHIRRDLAPTLEGVQPDAPWVVSCRSYFSWSPTAAVVFDASTGRLSAEVEPANACLLDAPRRRLLVLHGTKGGQACDASHLKRCQLSLEVRGLDGGAPARVFPLGESDTIETPDAFVDAPSGTLTLIRTLNGKQVKTHLDPATGAPAPAPRHAPRPRGIAGIPVGVAHTDTDLSPLARVTRAPRRLMANFKTPNGRSGAANGARSPDGRLIAVADELPGSEDPDQDLLLVDAATLAVKHRVHLAPYAPMQFVVAFLDDTFVTARFSEYLQIFHAPSGTLRAVINVGGDAGYALPTLLGDDLAVSGTDLVDLSRPRELALPPGPPRPDALVPLPWATEPDASIELLPGGRVALAGPPPPHLHCALGEWIVPFGECAHRLIGKRPAAAKR